MTLFQPSWIVLLITYLLIFLDFRLSHTPALDVINNNQSHRFSHLVVTTPSLASLSKGSAQTLLDGFQGPSFICDWRWAALAGRVLQRIDRRFPKAWTCDLMLSQCAKRKKGERREIKEKERNRKMQLLSPRLLGHALVFRMTQAGAPLSEHKIENKLL